MREVSSAKWRAKSRLNQNRLRCVTNDAHLKTVDNISSVDSPLSGDICPGQTPLLRCRAHQRPRSVCNPCEHHRGTMRAFEPQPPVDIVDVNGRASLADVPTRPCAERAEQLGVASSGSRAATPQSRACGRTVFVRSRSDDRNATCSSIFQASRLRASSSTAPAP